MSDNEARTLHEELEIRVIALLTGELPEAEADELEKILSVNESLADFRHRMAALIGEVHSAREEINPASAPKNMGLSPERRRAIFGGQNPEDEVTPEKTKVSWQRRLIQYAAVLVVLFLLSMMAMPSFQKVRTVQESVYFEAPALEEMAYVDSDSVNLKPNAIQSGTPRRQRIVENELAEEVQPLITRGQFMRQQDLEDKEVAVSQNQTQAFGRGSGGSGGMKQDGLSALNRELAQVEEALAVESSVPWDHIPEKALRLMKQKEVLESKKRALGGFAGESSTLGVDHANIVMSAPVDPFAAPAAKPRSSSVSVMTGSGEFSDYAYDRQADAEPSTDASTISITAGTPQDFVTWKTPEGAIAPEGERPVVSTPVMQPSQNVGYISSAPVDAFAAPVPPGSVDPFAVANTSTTETRDLLSEGRRRYLNGDYLGAVMSFDKVAAKDPNNAEAKLFKKKLSDVMESNAAGQTREHMLAQVEQAWERPKVFDADSVETDSVKTDFLEIPRTTVIRLTGFRDSSSAGPVDPFAAPSSDRLGGDAGDEEVEALKGFFQSAGVNFDVPGSSLAFDGENLIVSQSPRNLERMRRILRNYNEGKQAEVETKQLEVAADMAASISDKPRSIVIPQVNFSGMPLSKVMETLIELSVEYDPEGRGVQLDYTPVDGNDPRVNISLRKLNLEQILRFVTQQVNHEFIVQDDHILIQPQGQSAIEQIAQERLKNTAQRPKPEMATRSAPVSTFSLNVSDVSFKLAQAALASQRVPDPELIRSEEFVNSFSYSDPAPREDEPVVLNWEIAQHPYAHNRQIVRFSLQTQSAGRASDQALNLNVLLDNSGSMQRPDRRAILEQSLEALQSKLTDQDQLNIILFARQPKLIAEAGSKQAQQAAVADALKYQPEGGTNLEAGLQVAYETARKHYDLSASNRVILMTDGAANLGDVDASALSAQVVEQRKQGIALDAYGIGWEDYNDALLEEITRNGDGRYAFLNSADSAAEDFAEKLAGTLRVAAADVKVQILWNPERVTTYRQIGYDLHQLKTEDFRDNTVDAAEIGEAESGTALYVVKINEDPNVVGGLGTLQVRYRVPATGEYVERAWPLEMPRQIPYLQEASPSLRLAATSAFFAERLADNPYASNYSFEDLESLTADLPQAFPAQPRVVELQNMIQSANTLLSRFEY